jgi:serine/threonine-protein kinase MRCK
MFSNNRSHDINYQENIKLQFVFSFSFRLFIDTDLYFSGFTIYSLLGDQHPLSLVHPDNQMLGFLAYNPVDALGAVELPNREFLLVFNTLGVYVDMQGRKSRDREIMYPALPEKIAVCDGKLLVYSDTHIDVFDTLSGDWVQSINIRKTKPLLKTGHLNLSMLQEMPHVTFLSNINKGNLFLYLFR